MDDAVRHMRIGRLEALVLREFPLRHGFFTRRGGLSQGEYSSLNTAWVSADPLTGQNRELLFGALAIEAPRVHILNPCHGNRIAFVEDRTPGAAGPSVLIETDAAFTRTPGTWLLFSAADCIPALVTDSRRRLAGAIHLGWRNLVGGFTARVLRELEVRCGVAPADLTVAIGPSIHPCCYRFRDPVQKDMPFWNSFLHESENGMTAIDLVSAFKAQLKEAGVAAENVLETRVCTSCSNDLFFSCYRQGYRSGRFPVLVGLEAPPAGLSPGDASDHGEGPDRE